MLNSVSHACGQTATAMPMASVIAKAIAPPISAMRSARSR